MKIASHARQYSSLPRAPAVAMIAAGRGTHFGPDVAAAMPAIADRFLDMVRRFGDDCNSKGSPQT